MVSPGIYTDLYRLDPLSERDKRVEIRYWKDHMYSCYRRIWRLAGVYFDGKPVMIIQNAGREGDDFRARIVTDVDSYRKLIQYLGRLLYEVEGDTPVDDVHDPSVDLGDKLTSFYYQSLDGYFER